MQRIFLVSPGERELIQQTPSVSSKANKNTTVKYSNITDDTIGIILSYLELKMAVYTSGISKQWLDAVRYSCARPEIVIMGERRGEASKRAHEIYFLSDPKYSEGGQGNELGSIELPYPSGYTIPTISSLSIMAPPTKMLFKPFSSTYWTNLRTLLIPGCLIGDELFSSIANNKALANLTNLNIEGNGLTSVSLLAILTNNTHRNLILLNMSRNRVGSYIGPFSRAYRPKLQFLIASSCCINNKVASFLLTSDAFPNILKLVLFNNNEITKFPVLKKTNLSNLIELNLTDTLISYETLSNLTESTHMQLKILGFGGYRPHYIDLFRDTTLALTIEEFIPNMDIDYLRNIFPNIKR